MESKTEVLEERRFDKIKLLKITLQDLTDHGSSSRRPAPIFSEQSEVKKSSAPKKRSGSGATNTFYLRPSEVKKCGWL